MVWKKERKEEKKKGKKRKEELITEKKWTKWHTCCNVDETILQLQLKVQAQLPPQRTN